MTHATSRWSYTLQARQYKCHSCLCLMGQHSRCLNPNCEVYAGTLPPDKPYVHTYTGPVPRKTP